MPELRTKEIIAISLIVLLIFSGVAIYGVGITGNAIFNFNKFFSRKNIQPSSPNDTVNVAIQKTIDRSTNIQQLFLRPRFSPPPSPSIPIASCMMINKPGNYKLTKDLNGGAIFSSKYPSPSCILIPQFISDVSLDCNNHIINKDNYNPPPNNEVSGISIFSSRVTILNCNVIGYHAGITLVNTTEISLLSNYVNNNRYGIALDYGTHNTIISNNKISNSVYGISIGQHYDYNYGFDFESNINISSNSIYNNIYGITFVHVDSVNLVNNELYNNQIGGITLTFPIKKFISFVSGHFYNNGNDLQVTNSVLSYNLNLKNVIFDNPKGNFQNYTNFSFLFKLPNSRIIINWSNKPTLALPVDIKSFNNKFISITGYNLSSNNVVWSWNPQELSGYDESKFHLELYDGNSWTNAGGIKGSNTLTLKNFKNSGVYAIVEDSNIPFEFINPNSCSLIDPSLDPAIIDLKNNITVNFNSGTDYCKKIGYKRCSYINVVPRNPQLINKPCNIPIKCNVIPNTNTTTCFANIGNSWAGPPQISCCN